MITNVFNDNKCASIIEIAPDGMANLFSSAEDWSGHVAVAAFGAMSAYYAVRGHGDRDQRYEFALPILVAGQLPEELVPLGILAD